MSDTALLKLVEVGVLVLALVAFVFWQMRDLKRAREETARQRSMRPAEPAQPEGKHPEEGPTP